MRPSPEEVAERVNRLVDDYRDWCLWFLREDYYPETDVDRLRVLNQINQKGDRQAFLRIAELKKWLSPPSSE